MGLDPAGAPAARPDLLYRRLVDGGLVYDSLKGQVHHLNETAALIWEACQEGRAAADIARQLCDRYAVDPAAAEEGVRRTLASFARGELLR